MRDGVDPKQILTISFTNKSAGVLRTRLEDRGVTGVIACTFHSLGVKILRSSLTRFTIYDDDDSERLLKKIIREMKITEEGFLSEVKKYIAEHKDRGCVSYPGWHHVSSEDFQVGKVWKQYQDTLLNEGSFDFSDLILESTKFLIVGNPVCFLGYKHILVDEFQDTSRSQFRLLEALIARSNPDCVVAVGDGDQGIYGWRSADPSVIDNWCKKDCEIIALGANYRTTSEIVVASAKLIEFNIGRKEKILSSVRGAGKSPMVSKFTDEEDEAKFIARLCKRHGKYEDVAVLYRSNSLSAPVEAELLSAHIPYTVKDDTSFFGRAEIKDAISYLRVVHDRLDIAAVKRSICVPPRGIGEKALNGLKSIESLFPNLKQKQKIKFEEYNLLLQEMSQCTDAHSMIRVLLETTKYLGHTETERIENLDRLLGVARGKSLADFVAEAVLKDTSAEVGKGVTLMTLHASKGTEFPVVVIIGCEEGILPHVQSDNLEEERRLMYVGMTRAMNELHMTYTRQRCMYGKTEIRTKSRFIEEAGL